MFFVLGWKFTLLRIVFGIVLVFDLSYWIGKLVRNEENASEWAEKTAVTATGKIAEENPTGNVLSRWLKSLRTMSFSIIPAYIISVFVLGAFRAWLFPAIGGTPWGDSILVIIAFAIAGTLFVIPTAAEIPIVQTFMKFGLGGGPASALIITLPVISLPSVLMVRKVLTWRTLIFLCAGVALLGLIAGLIGMVFIG